MKCPKCGNEVMPNWTHCPFCGEAIAKSAFDLDDDIFSSDRADLEAGLKYCKNCGASADKDSAFCPKCKGVYFYDTKAEWIKYSGLKYCLDCASENKLDNLFCKKCGGERFGKYREEAEAAVKKQREEAVKREREEKERKIREAREAEKREDEKRDKLTRAYFQMSYPDIETKATMGDVFAQYYLASAYEIYEMRPISEVIRWYERAANNGYVYACLALAGLYLLGSKVPQDDQKAFFWYQKAAEKGYSAAQRSVGKAYESGRGVPQDYGKAFAWYQKAAEKGHSDAQCALGNLYEKGLGAEKDLSKAIEWYERAAAQGERSAKDALERLKK